MRNSGSIINLLFGIITIGFVLLIASSSFRVGSTYSFLIGGVALIISLVVTFIAKVMVLQRTQGL